MASGAFLIFWYFVSGPCSILLAKYQSNLWEFLLPTVLMASSQMDRYMYIVSLGSGLHKIGGVTWYFEVLECHLILESILSSFLNKPYKGMVVCRLKHKPAQSRHPPCEPDPRSSEACSPVCDSSTLTSFSFLG